MSKGIITNEQRQKQVISRLTNDNARLRIDLKNSNEKIIILEEKLEKALLYIEELQKYVFRGKTKCSSEKDDDEDDDNDNDDKSKSGGHKKRSKKSYRRLIPDKKEITDEEEHNIKNCPDCGNKLSKIQSALWVKILEFYEQDILPMQEWFNKLKKTTLIKITTGYCKHCKKRVSAIPIPKQKAYIGENIKQLIVYQTTVQQLSHSQITDFLESHLHFEISTGEIAHILSEQALKLKPALDDLIKSIRSELGVHMDETSYNIAFHNEYSGNYAWAMAGISSNDVVYLFGKNRGKGNAKKLLSDDYGAYANIFKKGNHALCWAHPHRKFRDLKNSNGLSKEKKKQCQKFYKQFSKIYNKVTKVNQTNFKKKERMGSKKALISKFEEILKPNKNDPTKLKTLKKTMLKKIDEYFVCIIKPNIPTTNNKAGRSLRHLVIKRKKSFGSKTPKGAEVMSILYSVVMSLWRRSEKDFFKVYDKALS